MTSHQSDGGGHILDAVTAFSTVIAALAAVVAAYIAVRALQATRRSVLVDQLVSAYGDLLAALAELTDQAGVLSKRRNGSRNSGVVLKDAFRNFRVAADRLSVVEPSIGPYPEYGQWIRDVAHNLAIDIVQAEWRERRNWTGDELADLRPRGISDKEWSFVTRSRSYQHVLMVGADLPAPQATPPDHQDLEAWWRPNILRFGDDDAQNVFSLRASYLTQSCRLLDDYVREYVIPWAQRVARETGR